MTRGSALELLAAVGIVLVPTVPATYLLWRVVFGGRDEAEREIARGRAAGTPFALISIVGGGILVVVVVTTLLVIGVRSALG